MHNLYYYQKLMRDIRGAIENGRFEAFRKAFYEMRAGDRA
ncbi:MAG: hypothetical protein AB2746_08030 [Candidatus Thiodiazotropha taylori]